MDDLQPGDLAIVIESVLGVNVGIIVQCIKVVGEHSLYGTVWQIRSQKEITTEYGGKGHTAHIPQKWLKKIKPGDMDHKKDIAKLSESDIIKQVLKRAEKLNW